MRQLDAIFKDQPFTLILSQRTLYLFFCVIDTLAKKILISDDKIILSVYAQSQYPIDQP